MAFFRHYELRGTHDWNNPLRPYIDGFELIVLLSMLFFGLFYAVEGIHSGPIWNFFTSWGAFFHLVVGLCLTVAALLLLRDWEYAIAEREEERRQHKQWQEERDRIAESGL